MSKSVFGQYQSDDNGSLPHFGGFSQGDVWIRLAACISLIGTGQKYNTLQIKVLP